MTFTTLAPPDTGHEAGPSRAALPVRSGSTLHVELLDRLRKSARKSPV